MKISLALLGFAAANVNSADDADRLVTNKDDWENNFEEVNSSNFI